MILDVMVESKDKLLWIMNLLRTDCLEFTNHRRGIVVRHHVEWPDGDEVTRPQGTVGRLGEVSLRNLLDNRLGHKHSFGQQGATAYLRSYANTVLRLPPLVRALFFTLADFAWRTSACMSVISSATESTCSRFQTASLTFS